MKGCGELEERAGPTGGRGHRTRARTRVSVSLAVPAIRVRGARRPVGNLSDAAARTLVGLGDRNVWHLASGMEAWKLAGFALIHRDRK